MLENYWFDIFFSYALMCTVLLYSSLIFAFQGTALGMCPKAKLFRGYIELEIQLREFDRCRKLYEKFLEFSPENCTTWMRVSYLDCLLWFFVYLWFF